MEDVSSEEAVPPGPYGGAGGRAYVARPWQGFSNAGTELLR